MGRGVRPEEPAKNLVGVTRRRVFQKLRLRIETPGGYLLGLALHPIEKPPLAYIIYVRPDPYRTQPRPNLKPSFVQCGKLVAKLEELHPDLLRKAPLSSECLVVAERP